MYIFKYMEALLKNEFVDSKSAVMFDIDDTLIHRDGTPVPCIIRLAKLCKRIGYTVVLMTAPSRCEWKVQRMQQLDVPWDYFMFITPRCKTRVKQSMNLTFILSVGDKPTDLGASKYALNTSSGCCSSCK
jgi:ribonucleotide monophosphatase NagD (HAD superfamily)